MPRILFAAAIAALLPLLASGQPRPSQKPHPDAARAKEPPPQSAPAERFFPYEPKVSVFPNGLRVVRLSFPSRGLVAYQTVVRVGSRNEVEPGRTGFAHFFEHMMFRGTRAHPEGDRERILGKLGFDDNAYTTDDFTVYHSYGPSSALEQLVELESDRFRNLNYSEPSFQTEAKAILGEYHKSASRPELKLEEALRGAAYQRHTYGHTTLGFYEDIQKMPRAYDYSKQFFERWYTPDNTVLVVVGDFDDARLVQLIEERYGPWKGRSAQVAIRSEPRQSDLRAAHVSWKGPTLPRQMVAWHTPAARLDRLDAANQEVLAAYLVGPISELHKKLVLEQQIAEELTSWYEPHRDPYIFVLDAKLRDEKFRPRVRAAFDRAVRDLVDGRIDKKRVEDIKSNIRYGFLMSLESADQVADKLAWFIGVYGEPDALERHFQNVRSVTPGQLVAFARQHFTARNRTEVTLTTAPASAQGGAQ
jgi:zinc protease